jgi:hypothetical protein
VSELRQLLRRRAHEILGRVASEDPRWEGLLYDEQQQPEPPITDDEVERSITGAPLSREFALMVERHRL